MGNITKLLSLTLFSMLSIMFSNAATAVTCGTGGVFVSSTDQTSIAQDCLDSVAGDANDSIADLNAGSFFGIDTWLFLDKTDDFINGGIDLTGGAPDSIDGTFSFNASIWDSYNDVVIVLKGGGSTTDKTVKWSAYHLIDGVTNGYWVYDGVKELSHLSVYVANPVPVPAAVWLFGSGLLGLIAASRRRPG